MFKENIITLACSTESRIVELTAGMIKYSFHVLKQYLGLDLSDPWSSNVYFGIVVAELGPHKKN